MTPLFIATEKFDSSDARAWSNYIQWAKIPNLVEVVGLDGILCSPIIRELEDEDWKHIVCENCRLRYFLDFEYLMKRIAGVTRRNVLGLYRNPEIHIGTAPATGAFEFIGYDLIEESTHISALTNCGGFPETFSNEELNQYGLISAFERTFEIKMKLPRNHPEEPHAKCEMYAIWKLNET